YLGSSASGQSYAIYPTQSVIADLATQAAALISSFAAVRDGPGQGMFSDGTMAAPGIRFASDQDTGLWRPSSNAIAFVTGGSRRVNINASGYVGIGISNPTSLLHISGGNIRLPTSSENENAIVAFDNDTFSYMTV